MQPSAVYERSISSLARTRAQNIKDMLRQSFPQIGSDQKLLDEGSTERAYWNFGYLSALEDILRLMTENN